MEVAEVGERRRVLGRLPGGVLGAPDALPAAGVERQQLHRPGSDLLQRELGAREQLTPEVAGSPLSGRLA